MAKNETLTKDQVERRVFAKFAEICPVQIRPETIQSRPEPEPDILCTTQSGEIIAFELVRCDDEGGSQSLGRGLSLKTAFQEFLLNYPRRKEFLRHLEGRRIYPYYKDGITKTKIIANFSLLCEFLLASDVTRHDLNPFHPIQCQKLQEVIREVSLGCPGPQDPIFEYFKASWAAPAEKAILKALERKRKKSYKTAYQIELLVWFGISPEIIREQTWKIVQEQAPSILEEVGFRRLWVFSWGNQKILWIYPEHPR